MMMTTPLPTATKAVAAQMAGSAAALAKLAQTRDADAWGLLLERHGAEMLRVAFRITGNTALAEDVCQETLLQLRDFAGKFQPRAHDPEGSARAWILRLTCNTALKLRRTRDRVQRRHHEAAEAAQMQNPASEPGLALEERARLAHAIRAELEHLPDAFQQPLALRYYGGLEVKQVAEQLRLSEDAARKRISRGLEQLRKRLTRAGITVAGAELGLLFAVPEAAEQLSLSSHHLAQWKGLLTSPQHAALPALATTGGISLIAKCAIGIAALIVAMAVGIQARNSWTSEAPAAPKIVQQTVAADDSIRVVKSITVTGDPQKFPYELPIELGDQEFLDGDSISIQQIRGTKPEFVADGEYQVCGIFTLKSTETAMLDVRCGRSTARLNVSKGSQQPFLLSFKADSIDFPRLSFTTGQLYASMGGVYFGHADSVFKKERLKEKLAFQVSPVVMNEGDTVTINAVKSDRKNFEIGGVYEVSGTYTLSSRADCVIAVFGTTLDELGMDGIDYMHGVSKGNGTFSFTFKLAGLCWPHVSFYPSAGGNVMGGTYFGTGDFYFHDNDQPIPGKLKNRKTVPPKPKAPEEF